MYRTAGELVCLAVIRLIVLGVAVPKHRQNVGKHCPWSVILVRVEEDSKPFKLVRRSKYWPRCSALFGQPECKPIAEKISFAANLELDFDLAVVRACTLFSQCMPHTSQLVAVSGTREKIQPDCDGRSEANRIYLESISRRDTVSEVAAACLLVGSNHCISTIVKPPTLHVRIKIWLVQTVCSELGHQQLAQSGP